MPDPTEALAGPKLAVRLASRPDLRKGMVAYWKLFRTYSEYIGCGYFVGHKPDDGPVT